MARILFAALGLVLSIAVAYLALLVWYDGDRIRSAVRDRLSERYGVALQVRELDRSYSLRPRISIRGMRVANAKRRDRTLIEIDTASFRISPWSLLVGPLTLDDIVIDGIRISVPVNDEGALYWDPLVEAMSQWLHRFDWSLGRFSVRNLHTESRHVDRGNDLLASAERIDGAMPRPEDLVVSASGVDANLETALPLRLHGTARLEEVALARQDGDLPVTLIASGYIGDKVLKIAAAGGNLLAGDPTERDPLRATVAVGASVTELHGTMSRDDPMHLALAVAFDKPAAGKRQALHVEMSVSDPGISWHLADIRVQQGDSELGGNIQVENQRGRRYFGGALTVSNVDYPETDREEAEEGKSVRQVLPKGDLFSHLVEFMAEFDADFTLSAKDSRLLGVPFRRITIETTLDRGALLTTIRNSKIRDTSLEGKFSATPAEGETALELHAKLHDAEVAAVLGGIEQLEGVTGRFDADLSLEASGSDTPSILGSTKGSMQLYLDDGAMPDKLATRIAGDVFTAIFADFEEDEKTPIRCAVVDFAVERGVANARRIVVDTGEFRMLGTGKIELEKGSVDVELVPRAKDFSLVSMRLPLRIHGSLDDLKLDPNVSEGVASLLTPIELGDHEKADCTPPPLLAVRVGNP